jgi:hypothetical protein
MDNSEEINRSNSTTKTPEKKAEVAQRCGTCHYFRTDRLRLGVTFWLRRCTPPLSSMASFWLGGFAGLWYMFVMRVAAVADGTPARGVGWFLRNEPIVVFRKLNNFICLRKIVVFGGTKRTQGVVVARLNSGIDSSPALSLLKFKTCQ